MPNRLPVSRVRPIFEPRLSIGYCQTMQNASKTEWRTPGAHPRKPSSARVGDSGACHGRTFLGTVRDNFHAFLFALTSNPVKLIFFTNAVFVLYPCEFDAHLAKRCETFQAGLSPAMPAMFPKRFEKRVVSQTNDLIRIPPICAKRMVFPFPIQPKASGT